MHLVYPPSPPQNFAEPLFPISPRYYSRPKRNLKQWFCKISGGGGGRVNKLHYGLCENGEYKNNRACTHAVAILSPAPPVNLYQVSFHRLILSDFLVSFWKPAALSLLLSALISSAHGSHSYPPGRFPLQN